MQIYDPERNFWRAGAPCPVAADHVVTVVHEGLLYALGGRTFYNQPGVPNLSQGDVPNTSTGAVSGVTCTRVRMWEWAETAASRALGLGLLGFDCRSIHQSMLPSLTDFKPVSFPQVSVYNRTTNAWASHAPNGNGAASQVRRLARIAQTRSNCSSECSMGRSMGVLQCAGV